MPPSRESSSSPDSLLSDDSYLYNSQQQQQQQHHHDLMSNNPQPQTRSGSNDASTPRSNTPPLLDLSEFAVKPPPILDELDKMAETMEPVDKLVSGAERAVAVAEMVNLLIDAEKMLGEEEASRAGEMATRGLEMAIGLDDRENIERAKRLLDLVGGAGQERKRDDEGNMGEKEEEENSPTERGGEMSFDDDGDRGASPDAGRAEVLGDFLADEFEEERDWGYECEYDGNENNEVDTGDDTGRQTQNELHTEVTDGDTTDKLHSSDNADNQGDQYENDQDQQYQGEQEYQYGNDFDPRNRPQTPVPPRSFDGDDGDEDMEIPGPATSGKDLIQRYDPWQAYADFKQKELFSSSEVNSNEEIYCDCDCRNCRKCHYNTHDSHFSSNESASEAETEAEDEDDADAITATIIRKRRRRDPIVSTNMNYTYTRNLTSKRTVLSSKIRRKGPIIPQYPKPWYRTDENADLDQYDNFSALFWHPHTKTLVLQEDVPDWDLKWLPVEQQTKSPQNTNMSLPLENDKTWSSSPQAGTQSDELKNYIPWRTDFWFHFAMPMRDMAPRVRKTDIFPEQAWEFIPRKEDWDMFEEALPEGERFSMQFLEWERERIQKLVREKSRKTQNGLYKQKQRQEHGRWMFVQVDNPEAARDWAMAFVIAVVALILLIFWLDL